MHLLFRIQTEYLGKMSILLFNTVTTIFMLHHVFVNDDACNVTFHDISSLCELHYYDSIFYP